MKRDKVLVEFDDSNVTHGWQSDNEICEDVSHCRVVGILKYEDGKKIEVALGDSDCGSKLETITIPKGCITQIRKLRVK